LNQRKDLKKIQKYREEGFRRGGCFIRYGYVVGYWAIIERDWGSIWKGLLFVEVLLGEYIFQLRGGLSDEAFENAAGGNPKGEGFAP